MSEGNTELDQYQKTLDPTYGNGTPNMWGVFTGSDADINRVNTQNQSELNTAVSSYTPRTKAKYYDLWSDDATTRAGAIKYYGLGDVKTTTKYNPNTGQYDKDYDYGTVDYSKVPKIGEAIKLPDQLREHYSVVGKPEESKQDVAKKFKYLRDPNAIYYDPNYGWIMDNRNEITKDNSALDKIGQYLPAVVGMATGNPWLAMLANAPGAAARANASHNWKGFLTSTALSAAGAAIPGLAGLGEGGQALADALKYAKYGYTGYNIYKGMQGGGSSTLQYPGVAQQPSMQTQLSGFNKQNLAAQMLYKQLAQPRKVTYTGR